MSTPGLPNFPTRKSLDAKIRKYSIAAHIRGEHEEAKEGCPLCEKTK